MYQHTHNYCKATDFRIEQPNLFEKQTSPVFGGSNIDFCRKHTHKSVGYYP